MLISSPFFFSSSAFLYYNLLTVLYFFSLYIYKCVIIVIQSYSFVAVINAYFNNNIYKIKKKIATRFRFNLVSLIMNNSISATNGTV